MDYTSWEKRHSAITGGKSKFGAVDVVKVVELTSEEMEYAETITGVTAYDKEDNGNGGMVIVAWFVILCAIFGGLLALSYLGVF